MDTDRPTMREGPLLELELLLGGEEDERTLPGSLHAFGVAATGSQLSTTTKPILKNQLS